MKYTKRILTAVSAGSLLALLLTAQNAAAVDLTALPDVSLLTPFTTFGNFYNDQNVTINGNVGISENGMLYLEAPSSINGNVYLGTGATTGGGGWPGNVNGTIYNNQNLAAAQAQVFSASTTLAGLTANVTVNGNVTSGQTYGSVNGVADVFVVDINGNVSLGSGENISFTGDAGDIFVLNVTGDVDMGGDAAIAALSQASQVLFNLTTAGSLGNVAHIGNIINGTTLIPNATYAEFHSLNGAIWSGYGQIKLMSGAKVQGVELQVPDTGSTFALMGLGLALLAAAKRKLLS